jgi:glycosyltransferase involved in cell wall biosynthesis
VDIYCVEREDNNKPFKLSKNVQVFPVLRFKQTFPSSYKIAPYILWKIVEILNKQIKKHDVFYIHDADLNFYFLCNQKIPTIISLRDFLYPETLLGAFNFRRDKILVNSLHTLESLKYTVGNYLPEIEKRVELIENGINLNLFRKVKPTKIFNLIEGKINKEDKIILFPHRPDPFKGIYQLLSIINKLKFNKKLSNIKLLIPRYIDEEVTKDLEEHYQNIIKRAKELGISENILFHKWVPYELMPEYYSLGDLTFSIGNFIEAFGSNVGLESLACGTPVIMSLVGAQRYTLPEGIVYKVAYGDEQEITRISNKILTSDTNLDYIKIRGFIKSNFSHNKMLKKYERVITNTEIMSPLEIKFLDLNFKKDSLAIAPWAYLTKFGIYSDYEYKYHKISKNLRNLLNKDTTFSPKKIKIDELKKEIFKLYEKGIFVIAK